MPEQPKFVNMESRWGWGDKNFVCGFALQKNPFKIDFSLGAILLGLLRYTSQMFCEAIFRCYYIINITFEGAIENYIPGRGLIAPTGI